jgi:hypothetical protein
MLKFIAAAIRAILAYRPEHRSAPTEAEVKEWRDLQW